MSNLQHRQSKIQEKRKQTPWRDFVMEICSRGPIVFYKNGNLVSKFPPTNRSTIIPHKEFIEYREELTTKGQSYQNSLFDSIQNLWKSTTLPSMMHWGNNENSDYVDIALGCQNSYLSIGLVTDVEGVFYSWSVKDYSSNVFNSGMVWKNCENIYSSVSVIHSFNIFYSKFIDNCNNIWFSSNLLGCSECLFCDGLQNQSYCINNKQLEKIEYFAQKTLLLSEKPEFQKYLEQVSRKSIPILSENVSGNGIIESNDVSSGYYIYNIHNIHNGRNLFLGGAAEENRNIYDAISFGSPRCRDVYGGYSINAEHVYCSVHSAGSSYVFYSYFLENCSFCLGCIGLKNKSYCILNKQYTKEEWHQRVDEIFSQMEVDGTLGQFFPASMNPFYFNDTAAYLIDNSFTKEEVTARGYLWRDEPIKVDIPVGAEVVKVEDLDKFEKCENGEWSIDKDILKKIIQDPEGNVYRIVPMEYDFLVKYGLPLPRKHWLDRMKENFRIG